MNRHGLAVLGQVQDQALDLGLGADVDAAGRLVEDEDLRVRRQPAREDDLLLVAAAQVLTGWSARRRRDLSRPMYLFGDRVLLRQARGDRSQPRPAWTARTMFSRTVRSSTIPSALRSSGQRADAPVDRADRRVVARRACRRRSSSRRPGLSIPNSRPAISVRPEPSRPASPTTSPARSSRSNGSIEPVRPSLARRQAHLAGALLAGRELDPRHVVELGEVPAEHLARSARSAGRAGGA